MICERLRHFPLHADQNNVGDPDRHSQEGDFIDIAPSRKGLSVRGQIELLRKVCQPLAGECVLPKSAHDYNATPVPPRVRLETQMQ